MAIEKSQVTMSVRGLEKAIDEGRIRLDMAIQRNETWSVERKSLFIHSILYGYPFPPVYAHIRPEAPNVYWFLDGKQRITAVMRYIHDEYAIDQSTPDIDGIEIAGKKFSELPEDWQQRIKNETYFNVYKLEGMTDDERDEMFRRLNNGMVLTTMELTRAIARGHVMEFVQELASKTFFAASSTLTDTQKNRMVDEELVLQIIYLIHSKDPVGLSGKDLRQFAEEMKAEGGLPEHQKALMRKVTDYLGDAFPVRDRILKKVNVPMLFLTAVKACEKDIPAIKFSGWAQDFFKRFDMTKHNPYSAAARAGSAKKENVTKRVEVMMEDFEAHIDTAPDYVQPQPKPGRKTDNSQDSVNVDE